MVRQVAITPVLARLAVGIGVIVILLALYLGFSVEATPRAIARSAKGHQIAPPAVVAVVTGIIALAGRRRPWAFTVACLAVAAAVVAGLLTVLLPTE